MQEVDRLLRLLTVRIKEGFGVLLNRSQMEHGKQPNRMWVVVLGQLLLFGVTIVKQPPKFMLDDSTKRLVAGSSVWPHRVRPEDQVLGP